MARFDKLELNPKSQTSPASSEQPTLIAVDAGDWMKKADASRRTGLYENALKFYSRALELDRTFVAGWVGQIQMLIQLQEYPEAELWSRKTLEVFPNNGETMAARAQAYCRMGDLKQAHALSDGSLQQPGQSAYRWQVRGEIMLAGRQDVDRHCFDKSQEFDSDWLVPIETALIYLYYGKPSRALMRANRALELTVDSHYVWFVQGLCLSELHLPKPARQSFLRCLELCPNHVDASLQLRRLDAERWSLRRLFGPIFRPFRRS
jgi:tetratricopeptide (TPR) repeat protein